jgi:hypothetical protein
MIVDDLNVMRVATLPAEADPPLPIDPNAILSLPIAVQRFQLIAGRNAQLNQVCRRVKRGVRSVGSEGRLARGVPIPMCRFIS